MEYRIIVPGILESALAKRIGSMWEIPIYSKWRVTLGSQVIAESVNGIVDGKVGD